MLQKIDSDAISRFTKAETKQSLATHRRAISVSRADRAIAHDSGRMLPNTSPAINTTTGSAGIHISQ
jgi:hypothetical protein